MMKNDKYPNFNFSAWLDAYAKVYLCPRDGEDFQFVKDYEEIQMKRFKETERCFFSGIHVDSEYEFCPSCEYFEILSSFNEFISILNATPVERELLLFHFQQIQPGIPTDIISKNLDTLFQTLDIDIK